MFLLLYFNKESCLHLFAEEILLSFWDAAQLMISLLANSIFWADILPTVSSLMNNSCLTTGDHGFGSGPCKSLFSDSIVVLKAFLYMGNLGVSSYWVFLHDFG